MILHHGTTLDRARKIIAGGPNPEYQEPGEVTHADGFSVARPYGPVRHGEPARIAYGKAELFPNDEGPVIMELDIPDEVVASADDYGDEIRFERERGIEELLAVWGTFPIRLIPLP